LAPLVCSPLGQCVESCSLADGGCDGGADAHGDADAAGDASSD
jgi:hypothetical protein